MAYASSAIKKEKMAKDDISADDISNATFTIFKTNGCQIYEITTHTENMLVNLPSLSDAPSKRNQKEGKEQLDEEERTIKPPSIKVFTFSTVP